MSENGLKNENPLRRRHTYWYVFENEAFNLCIIFRIVYNDAVRTERKTIKNYQDALCKY